LSSQSNLGLPVDEPIEVPLVVEVIRINPNLVVEKTIHMKMDFVWQEKTAIRFVMDDQKNIIRTMSDFVSVRGERGLQ
jgi:ribose 5-phosphate isomerase